MSTRIAPCLNDGRFMTDYRSSCYREADIAQRAGACDSRSYKEYLINNAEAFIMNENNVKICDNAYQTDCNFWLLK